MKGRKREFKQAAPIATGRQADSMPTDPSPEQIRDECERIQAGWSDSEKRSRALWAEPQPVEIARGAFGK